MKITVVMGFFLPVPPAAGGATEKTWHRLSREFAARGHEVTLISRRWTGFADDEVRDGVRLLRLPGFDHAARLTRNLWLDFRWSLRVGRALPPADLTIVNCVTLPVWLGWRRRQAGRVAVMPGRLPKGQFRAYRRIDRVLAVSTAVRDAILAENAALAPRIRITGYPIDWSSLAEPPRPDLQTGSLTIGYVGRIHREKGLGLLAAAAAALAPRRELPPWRLMLCGPVDVSRGGSGPGFAAEIDRHVQATLSPDRYLRLDPEFSEARLAATYRQIDIFCYPSLAARGETFGVAVAEAMAAGAVPVVSGLPSFGDFVHNGVNGVVVDHAGDAAAERLADAIAGLARDPARRARMARAARETARTYDYPALTDRLLADFSTLLPDVDRRT